MEKKMNKKKALLAASVAGLMAFAGTMTPSANVFAAEGNCQVKTVCAGKGACGGKGHSCAGKNKCAGQGWQNVSTSSDEVCESIGGKVL